VRSHDSGSRYWLRPWVHVAGTLTDERLGVCAQQCAVVLGAEKIWMCPNGHPVTGYNLYFSEWDIENDPPRHLLCGRCGVPLPRPLTRDVDEDEASFVATVRHRRRKREAKAAAERAAVEQTSVAAEGDPAPPLTPNPDRR
jgi:hypothetical protein